jgi:phosphopantetheine adenylyltransferase
MSKSLPSLLLLPPPPSPVTPASFSAAYRPSIDATVSALKGLGNSTEFLVALPYSGLHGRLSAPRSQIYEEVQQLLGSLYSLICVVCAKLGVDVESDTPGSIDARVILLDYHPSQTFSNDHASALDAFVSGPIIDLPTFAITRRRWNLIFSVDGEEGQKLLASYTNLANRISPPLHGNLKLISGGVSLIQNEPQSVRSLTSPSISHHVVAVGGTFDHIHAGHKLLLTATALLLQPTSAALPTPRRLIAGITGDELLKNKKYVEYLKSWKERANDVVDFLMSILSFTRSSPSEAVQISTFDEPIPNGRAIHTTLKSCLITIECVEIQDPFGPTITDESVTALVVSGETRSGGQAVNDKRREKGWKELEVFEVDVLDAEDHEDGPSRTEDFASKISSTEIRKRKAESARRNSFL